MEREQQEEEEAIKALEECLGENKKAEEEEMKAAPKKKVSDDFVQIAPANKTPPAEKADERQAEIVDMSAQKDFEKIEFNIKEIPDIPKIDFERQASAGSKKLVQSIETQTEPAPQKVDQASGKGDS